MRWLLVAALLASCLALGIASCEAFSRDHGPRLGFVPAAVSGLRAPGIDDDDRLQAMLSVHAHAYWPESQDRFVRVRDLDQAIEILVRDPEPAGASRRRRAIAKLASHGLAVGRDGQVRLLRFRDEIERLGVDPDFLETRASELDLEILLLPQDLEWLIQNWLPHLTLSCPWVGSKPEGGVRNPPPMGWKYTVSVPRHVADVARSFDPQKWDECTTFFPETYMTDLDGPCCPYQGESTDCSFTPDDEGRPPARIPHAAGRPRSWAPFYENYCTSENGKCGKCTSYDCDLAFRNQLCAETKYDTLALSDWWVRLASEYTVVFKLASWLRSERLGSESDSSEDSDAGDRIIRDEGTIQVLETTAPAQFGAAFDWSSVSVDKQMDFKASDLTQEYGQLLKVFEDEIGGQIAEQACCILPVESWSWWPFITPLPIRESPWQPRGGGE